MDGLLGGPKGMLAPPLKLLGGPGPPWPPSSYAYDTANVFAYCCKGSGCIVILACVINFFGEVLQRFVVVQY